MSSRASKETPALTRIAREDLSKALAKHLAFLNARMGGVRANLSFCDLSGVNLTAHNLSDADLTGASLRGAILDNTNLTRAVLFGADLRRAKLRSADLSHADLRGAVVRGADLTNANLFHADLRDGAIADKVRGGDLRLRQLELGPSEAQQATFQSANLTGAKMAAIVANHTDFSDAILRGCKMQRANLASANFSNANLEDADLSSANLAGADLSGAVLTGAELSTAALDGANMMGILTDAPAGRSITDLGRPFEQLLREHGAFVDSAGAEGRPLDVSGFDLRTVKMLKGMHLTALKAVGAVIYGMDLTGTALQGANLMQIDGRTACLTDADLRGANLQEARLDNVEAAGADFRPLSLSASRLMPVNLIRARLRYGIFTEARFDQADMSEVDLSFADLRKASLKGVKLDGARLTGTKLPESLEEVASLEGVVGLPRRG